MESVPDQEPRESAKAFERTPHIHKLLENFDNDDLILWRNGCKKCKAWEKRIDKYLLPMT